MMIETKPGREYFHKILQGKTMWKLFLSWSDWLTERIHSQIRNLGISNSLPPPKERHNKLQDVCFVFHHTTPTCSPPPNLFLELLKFPFPLPKHTPKAIKTSVSRDKTSVTYDKKVTSAASEQKDKPQINSSLHCVRPTPALAVGEAGYFFWKEDGRTPLVPRAQHKKGGQQEHIHIWQRCLLQSFSGC